MSNTDTIEIGTLVTTIDNRPGKVVGRQTDPFTGTIIKYRLEIWPGTKDRQYDTFTRSEISR